MLSTTNPIATVMRGTTVTVRLGSTLREICETLESVAPDASVAEVARRMVDGAIRHLPVAQDGTPVGVVSIRDLMAVALDG